MRRALLFLCACGVLFGCSQTPAPPTEEDGEEKPSATFWQLDDDSELGVKLDPWPPVNGKTTVTATTSPGDWGGAEPKVQSVKYRVVDDPKSSASYQSMDRTEKTRDVDGEKAIDHVYTAKDVAMPSGSHYVQFKIEAQGFQQTEFPDWQVKVP